MTTIGWVTNNPATAAKLRAADKTYNEEKAAASTLPLAEKINALRAAKTKRQAAYDKVGRG